MRIVIDGRMILPQMSGIGRYLINISRALIELNEPDDFELWLQDGLSIDHPARKLSSKNFHTHTLTARHMSFRGQLQIPFELARTRPDLLHYPHFDLPLAAPGPIVSTIHDLKYIARPDFFPHLGLIKRWLIRSMTKYTCSRAKSVICVSQYTAQDLRQRLSIPSYKIQVIPHGVEERFFTPIPDQALQEFRFRCGLEQPYILFVGERRPHKNLLGLIRAYKKFQQLTARPYQLVIAGKPYPGYQEPEREAQPLGDQVRFIDHIMDAELPGLFQNAEAFILLSYYEGFGLPILEAMASGVPVIASNCTCLPEVVSSAGLLVPPDGSLQAAEALTQVIHGGKERDRLIALGKEHASHFTWQSCARQTLETYRQAVVR